VCNYPLSSVPVRFVCFKETEKLGEGALRPEACFRTRHVYFF
jgi:hypothetical protein